MWVVRLEGDRFHSACKTFEDANNELKFLSNIGITASFKFKDFYSGNWHFLNDEEMIKEIQKLF